MSVQAGDIKHLSTLVAVSQALAGMLHLRGRGGAVPPPLHRLCQLCTGVSFWRAALHPAPRSDDESDMDYDR
jgi:hypothetical protein